jgi:hypothetical protein
MFLAKKKWLQKTATTTPRTGRGGGGEGIEKYNISRVTPLAR